MREHEEEKAGDGHVGDKPTLACYAHSPIPPPPHICSPPLPTPTPCTHPAPAGLAVGALVRQHLGADADVRHRLVGPLHQHHLDHPPLVQVRVEAGVPLRVQGPLPLHQLGTSTCTTGWISRHNRVDFTSQQVDFTSQQGGFHVTKEWLLRHEWCVCVSVCQCVRACKEPAGYHDLDKTQDCA